MTEKRFEYNHVEGFQPFIYDVNDNHMVDDLEIICELLNDLNDENEQLKFENIELSVDNKELKCTNIELNNENEQLKQELQDIYKLIDKKIEEYAKYDGYDTEKFYIGTQLLKDLKKGLKSDVE